MKIKQRLQNIERGYAEVFYYPENDLEETYLLGSGYVSIERIPYKADFEKDIMYYKKRWTIFKHRESDFDPFGYIDEIPYYQIGRITGYKTRKEALKDFYNFVLSNWSSIEYAP